MLSPNAHQPALVLQQRERCHAVHDNHLFLNIRLYVLHERNLRQVIVHAKHPGQRRQQQKPRQRSQDDVVRAFHAHLLNMPKAAFHKKNVWPITKSNGRSNS